MKGCPYDNVSVESTYKVIKTEFVRSRTFETLEKLRLYFANYVNRYNTHRIYSSLAYLSPVEFCKNFLKKVV